MTFDFIAAMQAADCSACRNLGIAYGYPEPVSHFHDCPRCFRHVACDMDCDLEHDLSHDRPSGSHVVCENCEDAGELRAFGMGGESCREAGW